MYKLISSDNFVDLKYKSKRLTLGASEYLIPSNHDRFFIFYLNMVIVT